MAELQNFKQLAKLDGLLGHLSSCTGLYAKETFLSLYSCITRMIRDHRMRGLVLTRTLDDEAFETMVYALEAQHDVSLFRLNQRETFAEGAGLPEQTGFLLALTDRFCATLHWTAETNETFRMYEGGWTFHPSDTRVFATHLIGHLADDALRETLTDLLGETSVDRRYDDKLNVLITSLVNGLENRNRELTLALERVNELNKKVVETERLAAIGQLCSVIAHEIRNPLGLIDLYAKLIEVQIEKMDPDGEGAEADGADRRDTHEKLLRNISLIRQATGSLEVILSELTDYSRPLQLNLQPVGLIDLVRDVCEFYHPSFQEKGVHLQIPDAAKDGDALNSAMSLDAGRIRQALINLMRNALEVSPAESTVKVIVASRKNDPNVYIRVSDEGPGVDPKVRAKLFTPYFSTKGNGTGLGLAHSRKILQAHGGTVDLLSSSPQGSTFALILPKNVPSGAEA